MRSTIHLVSADDCVSLRPVLQDFSTRVLYAGHFGRNIEGMDVDALVAAGRSVVEERPRTLAEIGDALGELWPDRDPTSMAYAIRNLLPLVQAPPRGLWGESGPAASTTAEAWLGRSLDTDTSPDTMVMRYVAAFGPAAPKDAQAWSGLTRLGEIFERHRHELKVFTDEYGRELFDLPDAPRPAADKPVPVRFLPDYDNVLLSHADRTRVMSEEHRKAGSIGRATILVDGFVRGIWKISKAARTATLTITPFDRLSKSDSEELHAEGSRLLDFATSGEADRLEVRFSRSS
jgi:hypothetical protein